MPGSGLITQNRYGSIDAIAHRFTIRAIHNKTLSGKTMVYRIMKLALACVITATLGSAFAAERIKLGYLVKQPEEAWFQTEWAYAEKAGKDLGFDVIKIGVPDGDKTLAAIDKLAADGAKGFVICAPDPKLGTAIMQKAASLNLRVVTVDDRLQDKMGLFMDDVPLMMMAARRIGDRQGQEMLKEMRRRGWKPSESGALIITAEGLETARLRTDGATTALRVGGFHAANIFSTPTESNDIPGAQAAAKAFLETKKFKNWVIAGMNDNTVLGGVRATEENGYKAENVIGVGINGVDAVGELSKDEPTGFYGSMLPSPDVHGYKSIEMLYNWVAKNVEPPKFVEVADTVLITRDNFESELKKKGLGK